MSLGIFQQLISIVIESSDDLNEFEAINNWTELTDDIFAALELNTKYFANRFDQIMSIMSQLLYNYQNQGATLQTCSHLFEIFVSIIEAHPSLIKKNNNRLLNLIQKLFQLFNMIDFTPNQDWLNPPEGYDQQNDFTDETNLTKQIMSYFDRIAQTYEYQPFVQFFNGVLPVWFNLGNDQWKHKYTLFMVMSQLGQDIGQPLLIQKIVQCGINSAFHQHPKIRYAVLHMFGQFSDDMKPSFQSTYGQKVLPICIALANDPVIRIRTHSMACITNFLQDYNLQNYHIIQPYINEIINISSNFLTNSNSSLLKQNSISTLSSLLTINLLTKNQINNIIQIIQSTLSNELHKNQAYNQLINQVIQCLSIMIYGQDKEKVQQYLIQIISIIKIYQPRISNAYYANAWSRLCLKYQNFTNLQDFLPKLLQRVSSMILSNQAQLQTSIASINHTIMAFKTKIKPYALNIVEFCQNGIKNPQFDDKQKQLLYEILQNLLINLKNQAPDPDWQNISKSIFTFFYQQIQKVFQENQTDGFNGLSSLNAALKGLQQIIVHLTYLFNEETLTFFAQKIFSFCLSINALINSKKNEKIYYQNSINSVQDDIEKQDTQKLIDAQKFAIQNLYEARLTIPDIFQSILKVSNKEKKIAIMNNLYQHIGQYLDSNLYLEDIRYGLYYLCNFIDVVGYQGIEGVSNFYEEKFCQFSQSVDIYVRNSGVYGLGVFISQIPVQKTSEASLIKWLNILWNSLSISINDNMKKKQFQFAQDNIVSALGKLIESKRKYFPNILNQEVHRKWFQNLPLNHDKNQGNIQHKILLKLLNQSPQIFLSKRQDLLQLLIIFGRYFSKRVKKINENSFKQNKQNTASFLKQMQKWSLFTSNIQYLWKGLSPNHRNILEQLMSN